MGFQIDEKLMSPNRAIITRNKTKEDIEKEISVTHKPGMLHYVAKDTKLWLSIDPRKAMDETGQEKVINLIEIMTENNFTGRLDGVVFRTGGPANAINNQFYINAEDKSPLVIKSNIKVENLNSDLLDGYHANTTSAINSVVARDSDANISINSTLSFRTGKILDTASSIDIKDSSNNYKTIKANNAILTGGILELDKSNGATYIRSLPNSTSTTIGIIEWKNDKWYAGVNGTEDELVTKKMITAAGNTTIISQATQPTNISNDDTYWFEFI